MNSSNYYKTINTKEKNWDRFNPISVELLKKLIDETDAKIVISSSWRFGAKQLLFKELSKTGLKKYLHKHWETPQLYRNKRGNEIKLWLNHHIEVNKYVIIDDADEILDEQVEYFIRTKIETGFGEENYQRAKKILME
jgi:hypothetical protein